MQNEQPPLGFGENSQKRLEAFLIFMRECRAAFIFFSRGFPKGVFCVFQKIFQKGIDFFPKT